MSFLMSSQLVRDSSHSMRTWRVPASADTDVTPASSPTSRSIVFTQWPHEMLGTCTVRLVIVSPPCSS